MSRSTATLHQKHIEAARRRVSHIVGLEEGTRQAELRIRDAAMERLAAVDADLAKLRPRAMLDDAAGDKVLELTQERGRLHDTIERSSHHLGPLPAEDG